MQISGCIVCSECSANKLTGHRICDSCFRLEQAASLRNAFDDTDSEDEKDELITPYNTARNTPVTRSLRTSPVSPQSQDEMDFMDYRDDILLPPTPYNQLYHDIDEVLTLRNGALSIVDESIVHETSMVKGLNVLDLNYNESNGSNGSHGSHQSNNSHSHSHYGSNNTNFVNDHNPLTIPVLTDSISSPQEMYEWQDAMKRLLLDGYVRLLWKESLQFNEHKLLSQFPGNLLMEQLLRWLTVSDCIDEYTHDLNIVVKTQRILHLTQYRKMQTIQRTKEWNRKCYHCFGTDTISRGGRAIWKFKLCGHDGNRQRPCILIGVVKEDQIESFINNQRDGGIGGFTQSADDYGIGGIGGIVGRYGVDCGTFNDSEHEGYSVYTGDWNVYHSQPEGQPFLSGHELNLTPDDVVAVELDLSQSDDPDSDCNRCGRLKFMVNGRVDMFKNGGIAFDDIDVNGSYRLAIGMYLRDRMELYQVL